MTIFQDKLLTRTDCDKAGDYVVPNVLNPRDLVFRPDIGHKLYHHRPLSDHYLFYGKVKFGYLGFSMGKSENSGFFRNLQPVT